jgi:hypothetical protein
MNKEKQKRQIELFLSGKGGQDVDAFCVYQWIERCHFQKWWDRALKLAPNVPPNSLDQHYHKRLDFLLSDCRNNFEQFERECVQIRNASGVPQFSVPVSFARACVEHELDFGRTTSKGITLELDNRKAIFLEEISPNKCVFLFYKMDSEELSSWLRSHGFEHLVNGIVRPTTGGDLHTARMGITWPDATNLIESLVAHLKESVPVYRPAALPRAPIQTSSFPPSGRKIQFGVTAIHSLQAYSVITFPPDHRRFFPGYKIPFILKTDIGDIKTHVASGSQNSQVGDRDEGKYIAKNLRPWARRHLKEIANGGLVTFECVEPGQIYNLSVRI